MNRLGYCWTNWNNYSRGKIRRNTCDGSVRGALAPNSQSGADKTKKHTMVRICATDAVKLQKILLHRYWTCDANKNSAAYGQSCDLVSEAITQVNLCEGFRLRGMLPEPWTRVPEPSMTDDWHASGINEGSKGCTGAWT